MGRGECQWSGYRRVRLRHALTPQEPYLGFQFPDPLLGCQAGLSLFVERQQVSVFLSRWRTVSWDKDDPTPTPPPSQPASAGSNMSFRRWATAELFILPADVQSQCFTAAPKMAVIRPDDADGSIYAVNQPVPSQTCRIVFAAQMGRSAGTPVFRKRRNRPALR